MAEWVDPDTVLTPLSMTDFSGSSKWLRNIVFEMDEQGKITGFRVSVVGANNVLFMKIGK